VLPSPLEIRLLADFDGVEPGARAGVGSTRHLFAHE
jgi:hypothetical protein